MSENEKNACKLVKNYPICTVKKPSGYGTRNWFAKFHYWRGCRIVFGIFSSHEIARKIAKGTRKEKNNQYIDKVFASREKFVFHLHPRKTRLLFRQPDKVCMYTETSKEVRELPWNNITNTWRINILTCFTGSQSSSTKRIDGISETVMIITHCVSW